MTKRIILAFCLSIFCGRELIAQSAPGPDSVPQIRLNESERLGRQIYELDRATRVANLALENIRDFRRDRRVKGFVTEQSSNGVTVSYVGSKGKAPLAELYRVVVSPEGTLIGPPAILSIPSALTMEQISQFRARAVALSELVVRCSKKYDTVVLPRSTADANWTVYTLPVSKKADVIPIGGSYRFEIDANGDAAVAHQVHSKACGELKVQYNQTQYALAHYQDPYPTEIHVYLNIFTQTPILVLTPQNKSMWNISKGKIAAVKHLRPPTAS